MSPDNRGVTPVEDHSDESLFPSQPGNAIIYFGKETLLSWLTDIRSEIHQEAVDRFYYLSRDRAYYTTSVYQLAEVATKVRYDGSAQAVSLLGDRIDGSAIRVVHGGDDWDETSHSRTSKDVFMASIELITTRKRLPVNFPEAALILDAARDNRNRTEDVYLFTFDGTLATLTDTFGIEVLPYNTPCRNDSNRR